MKALAAVIALILPGIATAQGVPGKITCKATGTWFCNTDPGGICIDRSAGRGERYAFDFTRQRFTSPTGKGSLSLARKNHDRSFSFALSDGRELRYGTRADDGDDRMSYLYPDAQHHDIYRELDCKP